MIADAGGFNLVRLGNLLLFGVFKIEFSLAETSFKFLGDSSFIFPPTHSPLYYS